MKKFFLYQEQTCTEMKTFGFIQVRGHIDKNEVYLMMMRTHIMTEKFFSFCCGSILRCKSFFLLFCGPA